MPLQLKPRPSLPPFTFAPPTPSPPPSPPQHARPPADFIPERDMFMFGASPLQFDELGRGLVKCTRCGRVVMEWAAGEHKRICGHVLDGVPLTAKKGTKGDKGLKSTDPSKRRRASDDSSPSPSRKKAKPLPHPLDSYTPPYPSLAGLKKSEIKRIQKERARVEKKEAKEREKLEIAERKRQRATCPINLDRQCGVINDKNLPCSRSLTCKTHTVGAKRNVLGRSRSYDILYLEWQRANNPNFKEPPQKKEKERREKGREGKKRREEDGGLEGDEGRREVEDLVALARMAGQRVGGGRGGGAGGGGVWRATTWEFGMVGDMLTKALAARSRPMGGIGGVPPPKAPGQRISMGGVDGQAQPFPVATM